MVYQKDQLHSIRLLLSDVTAVILTREAETKYKRGREFSPKRLNLNFLIIIITTMKRKTLEGLTVCMNKFAVKWEEVFEFLNYIVSMHVYKNSYIATY